MSTASCRAGEIERLTCRVLDRPGASEDLFHHVERAINRARAGRKPDLRPLAAASGEAVYAGRALRPDLGLALGRGEFSLMYQPFVSLPTGRVGGLEALLRWHHPVRGTISPDVFIPVAEQAGLIGSIGAWVLDQACEEAMRWPDGLRLAVNLSPLQLRDAALLRDVEAALDRSGLPPRRLELEVTESMPLLDDGVARSALRRFRELGISLVMDDFGAGFSSLATMRRFAFDKFKVDRSFVTRLSSSKDARATLRAILDMAHALRMATTVEGVETHHQLALIAAWGCDLVQGNFYSPPVAAAEVSMLLACLGTRTDEPGTGDPASSSSGRLLLKQV